MTHFLRKAETEPRRQLGQKHAAVVVETDGRSTELAMVVDAGIKLAGEDVTWALLPERFTVVGPSGPIQPERGLVRLVSLDTFDPFHLLADVRADLW